MTKIIVACDEEFGIGKYGTMPWHYSADMVHFVKTTMYSCVIMGSTTFYDIPQRPLSGRFNVVLSKRLYQTKNHPDINLLFCKDFDSALYVPLMLNRDAYVIGGGQIYKVAISHPRVSEVIMTHIPGKHNCDIFFPHKELHELYKIESQDTLKDGLVVSHYVKRA